MLRPRPLVLVLVVLAAACGSTTRNEDSPDIAVDTSSGGAGATTMAGTSESAGMTTLGPNGVTTVAPSTSSSTTLGGSGGVLGGTTATGVVGGAGGTGSGGTLPVECRGFPCEAGQGHCSFVDDEGCPRYWTCASVQGNQPTWTSFGEAPGGECSEPGKVCLTWGGTDVTPSASATRCSDEGIWEDACSDAQAWAPCDILQHQCGRCDGTTLLTLKCVDCASDPAGCDCEQEPCYAVIYSADAADICSL